MAIDEVRNRIDPITRPEMPRSATQTREEVVSEEYEASGSMAAAIGGIAAIVLAIVGLAGVLPTYLDAIAAIVLGASFLIEGGATAGRFGKLLAETEPVRFARQGFGGGVAAQLLGGIAVIVLGILSLLNLVPTVLLSISAIVVGAVLMFSCGTARRLNTLACERTWAGNNQVLQIAGEVVSGAAAVQGLVGLAAVILGILGVIGLHALTLCLVAFLCVGAAMLLSGAAMGGKMVGMLNR